MPVDRDIIVLSTPEVAKLAPWVIALVAAGGLAAALSTASGLLLVISSSVAHDIYFRMIDPRASESKRVMVGRIMIGFVAELDRHLYRVAVDGTTTGRGTSNGRNAAIARRCTTGN